MGWQGVAKILEGEKTGEVVGQAPTHLQLIIVRLHGRDSNNKVDPVLRGEGV